LAAFALGHRLFEKGSVDDAIRRLTVPEIAATELSSYALYFIGRELSDRQPKRARDAFTQLTEDHPEFVLIDEARLHLGRLLEGEGDYEQAAKQYFAVLERGHEAKRGQALFKYGDALIALGRKKEAVNWLEELYYEMPTDRLSRDAGRKLRTLQKYWPPRSGEESYRLAFDRAELLFEAGKYRNAHSDYDQLLKRFAGQVDKDLVHLRRGICQYRRRQNRSAEATLARVKRDDLKPEALHFRAEAARRRRRIKTYQSRCDELLKLAPRGPWAEETLWSLARYYLLEDDMGKALHYYGRIAKEFPRSKYYVPAQWRILWDQYRNGRYSEAATGFELAAREHPNSDELARFLYWGGRSHEKSGHADRAAALYRQVIFGYKNTYYGRQAAQHLSRLRGAEAARTAIEEGRTEVDLSKGLEVIREDRLERVGQLMAVGLSDLAETEARRAVAGEDDDTSFLALLAWIHFEQGHYRDAIVAIRRAFPFHVSATGDLLPEAIWKMLYHIRYWDEVERYSKDHNVDPYVVVALIRQESTFNPRVRSRAGARGLMQIMPRTGRTLARQHRQRYRTRDLYDPEINIRYGTHYLKEILDRFGGRLDYALASYNAGPHRVKAWTGMDLTLDSEEFIEEIPFTETRNYVKLVLRNEMLYRRLYHQSSVAVD
jgi:soluble lytic murein transglycosylase